MFALLRQGFHLAHEVLTRSSSRKVLNKPSFWEGFYLIVFSDFLGICCLAESRSSWLDDCNGYDLSRLRV